jgi:hypothetical protein
MMNWLRVWGGKIKDYTETGRRPLCECSLRECSKAKCVTQFSAPLNCTELKCSKLIIIVSSRCLWGYLMERCSGFSTVTEESSRTKFVHTWKGAILHHFMPLCVTAVRTSSVSHCISFWFNRLLLYQFVSSLITKVSVAVCYCRVNLLIVSLYLCNCWVNIFWFYIT